MLIIAEQLWTRGAKVKAFLDNFAAILGATTAALLLVSVMHEYGYFWIVGSRFQTFLSTTDYFSNAILWLPWLFVMLYSYVDWDVLLGKRKYGFGWNWGTYLWFLVIFGTLYFWPTKCLFSGLLSPAFWRGSCSSPKSYRTQMPNRTP
jgi:hypothetical protein